MTYKVTMNNPGVPKGEVSTLVGLGELENGKSRTVSDEEAAQYLDITGTALLDINNVYITVEEQKATKAAPKKETEAEDGGES